jgi:lipopolysaccharide cholinephosphotransferase
MKLTKDYMHEASQGSNLFYELSEEERIGLKKCLLEIYQDVVRVCDKYNLCIMLVGGSALGAVRHHGFIPWDDDMDTAMPRKDYNKFIAVFKKELSDKYEIVAPQTDETSGIPYMQILKKNTCMVCIDRIYSKEKNLIRIDIFPLENASTNKILRKIISYISFFYRLLVYSVRIYKTKNALYRQCFMISFKSKLIYYTCYFTGMILSVFFSQKTLVDSCDKFHSAVKNNKFCTIPCGRKGYYAETLPREVFLPPSEGVFEGINIKLPNDVNAYLTNLYGNNYMEVPPVEKRERHYFTEFNLDTAKKI